MPEIGGVLRALCHSKLFTPAAFEWPFRVFVPGGSRIPQLKENIVLVQGSP